MNALKLSSEALEPAEIGRIELSMRVSDLHTDRKSVV